LKTSGMPGGVAFIDIALLPLLAGIFTTLLLRAKNCRYPTLALILTPLAVSKAEVTT
jgi:hypothetical protein